MGQGMATKIPRTQRWKANGVHRLRAAHLLPSLFTSGNVACGVASILTACDGKYYIAGWLIMAGFVFDALDGRIAKLLRTSSNFGVQLDSLADAITFGIAPAILFRGMLYPPESRLGFSLAILYALCTVLRLARYNVGALDHSEIARSHFVGLPCPCSAALLASLAVMLREFDVELASEPVKIGIHILIGSLSVLMVSRIRYPDLIALRVKRRTAFNHLVVVAVVLSLGVVFQAELILIGSAAFIIGGPFLSAVTKPKIAADSSDDNGDDTESFPLSKPEEEEILGEIDHD